MDLFNILKASKLRGMGGSGNPGGGGSGDVGKAVSAFILPENMFETSAEQG